MRDLQKDLALCESINDRSDYRDLIKFACAALAGWPEAVQRALAAEARVKELESELAANARVLAQQCDLAREAEARALAAEKENAVLEAGISFVSRTADKRLSAAKEALEKLKDLLPEFGGLDGRVWRIIDEALAALGGGGQGG